MDEKAEKLMVWELALEFMMLAQSPQTINGDWHGMRCQYVYSINIRWLAYLPYIAQPPADTL